jgi:hypothetical protein
MRLSDSRVDLVKRIVTILTACIAPVLYFIFVESYATNSFYGDDWSIVPLINATIHGNLSPDRLWSQYNESRLFVGDLVGVAFGVLDHFDVRAVILFNAILLIASYAVLLAMVRLYAGKRLTPLPVLLIGIVWFSLADVQNALWAFQVSWYLTVFFFLIMLCCLFVPRQHRWAWFGAAALAALAASLTTIQGFLLWPLGFVALLWTRPPDRKRLVQLTLWVATSAITAAIYFPGYSFRENGCRSSSSCSLNTAIHHPLGVVGFFFALLGSIVPGGNKVVAIETVPIGARFELLGFALFAASLFVLVRSWRRRAVEDRLPLPFMLISFGLLLDVMISLSRGARGPGVAVANNRYVMAGLIVLTGLVIYTWAHVDLTLSSLRSNLWRQTRALLTIGLVTVFVVVQAVTATQFGFLNGPATQSYMNDNARLLINLGHMPPRLESCEAYLSIITQPGAGRTFGSTSLRASKDGLGEFQVQSLEYYQRLGPPPPFPRCADLAACPYGSPYGTGATPGAGTQVRGVRAVAGFSSGRDHYNLYDLPEYSEEETADAIYDNDPTGGLAVIQEYNPEFNPSWIEIPNVPNLPAVSPPLQPKKQATTTCAS